MKGIHNPLRLLAACIIGGWAAALSAGDLPAPASPRDDLNMRGVFTSDLPDVGRKHRLRVMLHPHFGDLIKYDHFRTDLGLKYTLSNRLELQGAAASYFAHGLGDASFFENAGFGALQFGGKYRFGERLLPGWDGALGAGYSMPISRPPVDVTDGLEHRTVFVTFARPWQARPDLRVFWGLGTDFVSETSTPGRHDDNELRDDQSYLSGGFIIDRGRTHYTFEAKWTTTRLLGNSQDDVFELRPGIIWELGRPRDDGARSRWLLGLGLSTTFGPDGTDVSLSARVRLDLDFKRLWRRGHRPSARR